MCCNNHQNLERPCYGTYSSTSNKKILPDATSVLALYCCYILPCACTWSRNFHYCTSSHPTVPDPNLHILIFSNQHICENLTSCNVTYYWKTFDFHSSIDENLYLLRCYTKLIVNQSYSSAILSILWWLVKWLTSQSTPEHLTFNPLAYTDVPETARLARSINTQPAVRRNSDTNPTSQHNRGMYWSQ